MPAAPTRTSPSPARGGRSSTSCILSGCPGRTAPPRASSPSRPPHAASVRRSQPLRRAGVAPPAPARPLHRVPQLRSSPLPHRGQAHIGESLSQRLKGGHWSGGNPASRAWVSSQSLAHAAGSVSTHSGCTRPRATKLGKAGRRWARRSGCSAGPCSSGYRRSRWPARSASSGGASRGDHPASSAAAGAVPRPGAAPCHPLSTRPATHGADPRSPRSPRRGASPGRRR